MMMETLLTHITNFSAQLSSMIWGLPMVGLLFGSGLIFTIYFGFPQIRFFIHSLKIIKGDFTPKDPSHKTTGGELSPFQALCAALSATIGLGNIAGVAVAIQAGGPGALFWMWVAALLGMASKFTDIALAVRFRDVDPQTGETHGGPMFTIKNGLSSKFYPLAILFALFTVGGALGAGNMFQSNQMTSILSSGLGISPLASGFFFTILTGLVLVGGIQRIGKVAEILVPFMVVVYFIGAVGVVLYHIDLVPSLFYQIFHDAFTGTAAIGGFAGVAFKEMMIHGVRRAMFSNEAGLGSSAMAHSTTKARPVAEGFVGMLEPFIDTIVVCTLTALVILITGAWQADTALTGASLTSMAFSEVYGPIGGFIVGVSVVLFAFSTIISWSYYGEKGVVFLWGKKAIMPYRVIFSLFVLVGAVLKLDTVLNFSDSFLGLMLIPNLISTLLLAPKLKKELKQYKADLLAKRL